MRSFSLICIILSFIGCSDNVTFHELDLATAQEKARQYSKKVLIDFWADG